MTGTARIKAKANRKCCDSLCSEVMVLSPSKVNTQVMISDGLGDKANVPDEQRRKNPHQI